MFCKPNSYLLHGGMLFKMTTGFLECELVITCMMTCWPHLEFISVILLEISSHNIFFRDKGVTRINCFSVENLPYPFHHGFQNVCLHHVRLIFILCHIGVSNEHMGQTFDHLRHSFNWPHDLRKYGCFIVCHGTSLLASWDMINDPTPNKAITMRIISEQLDERGRLIQLCWVQLRVCSARECQT